MTTSDKINIIIRHIKKVEDNCNSLAKKFMDTDPEFSRNLIIRGRLHDASKFTNFEFDNLWKDSDKFYEALAIHHKNNSHHPEYYENGILGFSELDLAEMVCDCLARSQEFGTDIRKWFFGTDEKDAPAKYGYSIGDDIYNKIKLYLDKILTPAFK